MVAGLLSEFCKMFFKLYLEQIKGQKQQCDINVVAFLAYKVQKYWIKKKLVATYFIDVKKVFYYISKTKLVEKMIERDIDKDII